MPREKSKPSETESVEPVVEPTETESPTKTYTEAELQAAREEGKTEAWKKYQGIQQSLTEKDLRIKDLEARAARRPSSNEIMLEEMRAREREFGEPNPRIAALEAALQQEKQMAEVERITEEARSDIVGTIVAAGQDPTDEKFDSVWDSFEIAYLKDGKFERAKKRAENILAKGKPKEEPKPEAEPEETEEEMGRRYLEKRGLLKTETGEPSASGKGKTYTGADIEAMSPSEWKEAFGSMEGFMKAWNEGRVKLDRKV